MKYTRLMALAAAAAAALEAAFPVYADTTGSGTLSETPAPDASTESEVSSSSYAGSPRSEKLISRWYSSMLENDENFIFSPYSLLDCVRILYPAASGDSLSQMGDVLGLDSSRAAALKELDDSMIFENGIGMKSANKAYVNASLFDEGQLHPEVLDAGDVDISTFDDQTYEKINEYISGQTEQKIRDLLTPDNVSKDTVSVLLNCLYFNNTWDHEEDTLTWEGKNEVSSFSDTVSLYNVKESGPVDILRLSYMNAPVEESEWGDVYGEPISGMHTYALYVICDSYDSADESVDSFMTGLSVSQLDELIDFDEYDGLEGYTDASFNVPQFEIRTRGSLSGFLKELGLTAPFYSQTTDFESFGPVFISDVLQEAYMKTTQSGTEAAAATAMIAEATAALDETPHVWKYVVADSPFAVILRDDTAREILFVGRVGAPGSADSAS